MTGFDRDGTFDIFRQDEAGAIWVRAVRGRDEAIQSLLKLRAEKPTQIFLLWDSRTRQFLDLPANAQGSPNE
jgi:hypothetical protein